MKHPYAVVWLADGCMVQALPTPRGRRNALLLNRGLVTAVLRVSEEDYQGLIASGPVFKDNGEGRPGGARDEQGDGGRSTRQSAARRPRVGVVPRDDASTANTP